MRLKFDIIGDILQDAMEASDKKEGLDLSQVPDRVKFSKVEDFFRNASKPFCNTELTRRIFTSYIQNGILPEISEVDRPNNNLTLYTRDQIIFYFLAQQLKELTKLENISTMFAYMRELSFDAKETFDLYYGLYEEFKELIPRLMEGILKEILDEPEVSPEDVYKEEIENLMPFILLIMGKACIDYYNEYIIKLRKRTIEE